MKKLIISIFVLSTLLSSCNNNDNLVDNKQPDFVVTIDEVFQLSLHSSAADGGYRWVRIKNESSIVDSVNYTYTIDSPESIGSPGTDIWSFKGVRRGTESMRFEYKRSFEGSSPIQTKVVIVKVE